MADHTPLPWATDGTYVVAKNGPTIADCCKSPSMDRREQRANADFILRAVNEHADAEKALWELCTNHGFATGHGDTLADIVREIDGQINERLNSHDALKASLAEMVGIYWGDGDGLDPPPGCIQRALAALASIKEIV